MKLNIVCKLCNCELHSFRALGIHLHCSHKDTSKQDYYDKFLKTNKNEGVCIKCGKQCNFISLTQGYHTFCSVKCQTNDSTINEKRTKSKFEHYGKGNYFSKEGLESISKCQSKIANERMNNTIDKLKKEYNIPEEIVITNISQIQQIKDKVAQTNIKNCGNKCSLHGTNQINTDKAFENKYCDGITSALQVKEIRQKAKKKFIYNNIEFDSTWEIAYFIWLKDHNIQFEYQPCSFIYYFNGKPKKYFPDFRLLNENVLVEIKNPYLLNNMKNDINSKEHYKYKCMLEHNVKIMDNCDEYINYVNSTYGPELFENCKRVKRSRKRTKVVIC